MKMKGEEGERRWV